MSLDYKLEPLPNPWPGVKKTAHPKSSPFKTRWVATLAMLEREIKHLSGRNVVLHIDVLPRDIRVDGGLRANARPARSVVLAFSKGADRLIFPSDQYPWWEDNVYAIAKTLEALRAVERWGVQQGRQYEGFKALPSATSATLSAETAAALLATPEIGAGAVLHSHESAQRALRWQRAKNHPDIGGAREKWDMIEAAAHVVGAHHGRKL